jgi:hypothetical protein
MSFFVMILQQLEIRHRLLQVIGIISSAGKALFQIGVHMCTWISPTYYITERAVSI